MPDERRLPGFVEHCRWQLVPIVAFRTLAWALLPWALWRRVKLHHEVRPWRLLAWACVVLVGWHVANAGLYVAREWSWNQQWVRYFQLNPTRAYGVPMAVEEQDYVRALVQPFFRYSERYWPSLTSYKLEEAMTQWNASWISLVVASFAYPLLILALRGSRHLNNIRAGHVLRAGVYALAWVSVPLLRRTIEMLHEIVAAFADENLSRRGDILSFWRSTHTLYVDLSYAVLAWLGVYWLIVMTRGWRFRQAYYHWALITVIVGLVCALVVVVVNPFAFI